MRPINNVLLVLLILVNLYIILTPVLPGVLFHWQNTAGKRQQLEQTIAQRQNHNNSQQPGSDAAGSTAAGTDSSAVSQPTGQEQANSIIIPAMLLDQPVVEGANAYRALDKGIWRWPGGSTPDKGGNTVLAGHRFTYTTPKGVFYFLDKLHIGDTIAITWSGHTYAYKVTTTKVVKPTQTEILNPTRRPTLTLYTCTPLWSPKDRLVVTAELQTEVSS